MDIKKHSKLPVSFTINGSFDTEDSRYLPITIDVLHTGLNFNGSIFEKTVVDKAADSIMNTPVLGYLDVNEDGELDFTKHEYIEIESESESDIKYKYVGSAYGVIPESCNYRWVRKISSDGIEREYFQVDALLWTKLEDAVSVFQRDGGKAQSMELELSSITGEEQEDGIFVFCGFKFDGCCLLSSTDESIQPAMIDSVALPCFTVKTIADEIKTRLSEYSKISINEPNVSEITKEGGNFMSKKPEANFTLNVMEMLDELRAGLSKKVFVDRWGDAVAQYYLVDVQDNELIVVNRADHYRHYGLAFAINGDSIAIDFESAVRKKCKYVPFEDGAVEVGSLEDIVFAITEKFDEELSLAETGKDDALNSFTELKTEFDEMKPKYDKYVQQEINQQNEAIELAKNAEFERFDAHLITNTSYTTLKAERDKYSLEDIQRNCAIMFTEASLNANFSKKSTDNAMTSDVFTAAPDVELSERYGVLPVVK